MKLRYVGNAPFFSDLSEEEQALIAERMHLEHRRGGEILFSKGDDSTALYLVKSGWIRLVDDRGAVLANQGPGSLVGETDLFLERPRSLGAGIASDAELWILTREDLVDLIADSPQIGIKIALIFGARLPAFDRYLVEHRLADLPFLAGLDEASLASIAHRLVPVEKHAGEFIVEEGQPPEALFIVESGTVHLHGAEDSGEYAELGPGETFGEMSLLTGKGHSRSAQAATDLILWALPTAEFEALADKYSNIRPSLSRNVREPLLPRDLARANERLARVSLFSGLSAEVLTAVASRMLVLHVPAGELIFAEGSPGDALFVVDAGQVELISGGPATPKTVARLDPDDHFGHMALLTGKPRKTAARAADHTNLWVLYRADFDDLVSRHPSISVALSKELSQQLSDMDRHFTESHLRSLKLLSGLSSNQLEDVGRRLTPTRYRQGEVLIQEGAPGREMYFIESGTVHVIRGFGPNALFLAELGAGDLVGEMSLLTGNPRSASVIAMTDLNLWVMAQADFDALVGSYPNLALALSRLLSERLRVSAERYPAPGPVGPVPVQQRPPAPPPPPPTQPPPPGRPIPVPVPVPVPVPRPPQPVPSQPAPPPGPEPLPVTRTQPVAQPAPIPQAAPEPQVQAAPPPPAAGATLAEEDAPKGLLGEIGATIGGVLSWFGSLSGGAKLRLAVVTLLLVWITCIAAPALLIATLTAQNVTNLEGAVAFVQVNTAVPGVPVESMVTAEPQEALALPPLEAQASMLGAEAAAPEPPAQQSDSVSQSPEAQPAPQQGGSEAPSQSAEVPGEAPALELAPDSQPAEVNQAPAEGQPADAAPAQQPESAASEAPALEMASGPTTPTPWVIVVTNTPLPPTETPIPPTATPIPPTATPRPPKPAQPAAPTATPKPLRRPQPPRELDARLPLLNVNIVEPQGLQPGQAYWRLTKVIWQNGEESGNDHTIYITVLDENGGRVVGQPVEMRWQDGVQKLFTEDKALPDYPLNFPMFGTLGSYAVSIPGLPSDTIVGMGMGTPEQPAFTIHTNFFLVFQRTSF